MKKLLLIVAHPKQAGQASLLSEVFAKSLISSKYEVEIFNLFKNNIPVYTANRDTEIPVAVEKIKKSWLQADTIAFFLPNWWGVGPTPLVDLMSWNTPEIADFSKTRPQPKMKGKKVLWVVTGAAPKIVRKMFFKTDPERWGKYIFGFSGAKFTSIFFDSAGYGTGKLNEKFAQKIKAIAQKI